MVIIYELSLVTVFEKFPLNYVYLIIVSTKTAPSSSTKDESIFELETFILSIFTHQLFKNCENNELIIICANTLYKFLNTSNNLPILCTDCFHI